MPSPYNLDTDGAKRQSHRRPRLLNFQLYFYKLRIGQQQFLRQPLHHSLYQLKCIFLHKLRYPLTHLTVVYGLIQIVAAPCRPRVRPQDRRDHEFLPQLIFLRKYPVVRKNFQSVNHYFIHDFLPSI